MKRGQRSKPILPLNEFEITLLELIWERGECTVRELHEITIHSKYRPYTTLAAILRNLSVKKFLKKRKKGKAFHYSPKVTREDLGFEALERVCREILGIHPELVLDAAKQSMQ